MFPKSDENVSGLPVGRFLTKMVPQESSMGKAKLYKSKPGPIHRHRKRKDGKLKNSPADEINLLGRGISYEAPRSFRIEVA